jgi:ribonucleoside-triphosphate reductase
VLEPQSYQPEFKELMIKLEDKYGKEIFEQNGLGRQLDISQTSKQFFKAITTADVSVDANANVADQSVISHKIETSKPFHLLNSYYRLWKEIKKNRNKDYADKLIEAQITGELYVNDFAGFSSAMAYCFNYSTFDTAINGIPNVFDGRGGSKPPKSLMAFLGQIELFSLIAGNSTLGATGLADLLIVISIYMDKILRTSKDAHFTLGNVEDSWQYLESILTGFIYRLNQPYRGSQSLFTNVSVYDKYFLENMIGSYVLDIDEEFYSATIENVQKVQDIYLNIMNREMARKPITFPVTTACFAVDDDKKILDQSFKYYIANQNLKFGFINIYSGKSSTLSSCCRLRSEQDNEYFNSFGSGSTKIGSLGVVTGNLPQLAVCATRFETESMSGVSAREVFLNWLKELVIDCQEINQAKRSIIKRTILAGRQPLYTYHYMDIKKQYSTFGVVGLYESLKILELDITSDEGQDYVLNILDVINTTNAELQKRFKSPHNCEQIPAENVAVKLAKKDRLLGFNDSYSLYSNQFIPLTERVNMLDRIELQGKFDSHFSGGALAHLNVDQKIKDEKLMADLIETCANRGVVYFAINYVLQECENGHMSVGNVDICPICGGEIVGKFTRVVGFLTKIANWIKERRELDFPNRQFYGDIK